MEKISFLLADEILKKEVEQILWIYRSEQEKIDIRTEIGIIDLEHIEKQAQDMIAGGAQVIITNSGSHSILSRTITEVPILCLYSSTSDTLYTLHQVASYNTIHLLLNKNFIFNAELCSDDIKKKLKIHSSYSVDTTYHNCGPLSTEFPSLPTPSLSAARCCRRSPIRRCRLCRSGPVNQLSFLCTNTPAN